MPAKRQATHHQHWLGGQAGGGHGGGVILAPGSYLCSFPHSLFLTYADLWRQIGEAEGYLEEASVTFPLPTPRGCMCSIDMAALLGEDLLGFGGQLPNMLQLGFVESLKFISNKSSAQS